MFENVRNFLGFGTNSDDVYVPTNPAEAESFDPDYVPSPDTAGDEVTEVGDIPDAEVNK